MNDQAVDNARREKRYERIREKVHTEYTNEVALLRERKDYIAAYEYFLELMQEPYHAGNLRQRVKKPLIGLFCIHAPLELLDAFGVHPVKLCSGSQTVQRVAASYLPVLMCPMLKSFMGNFDLQGESFKDYEMIVLPTTCDWVVKLPEIMGQPLDNVHYLELPHLKGTDKAQNRWLEEMYSLKKILEKAAQKRLSAQKLLDSIDRFTKLWALLEELKGFKRNGKISCVWYTLLTNTFLHDDLERWSENIVKVLEQLRDAPVVMSEGKVFVAGSPVVFPNLKLLQLIEQAGMTVIADDLCSSERILPGGVVYRDTSESGLIRALAERYHKACICPTFADNDRRINGILSTAEAQGIRGVIFNLLKGCHPYDIEAITIEQKLKKHGLKFLKIETDYGKEDSQNILTRLEAFSKTL